MKRYTDYKDSGVEWIGEVPTVWDIRNLKFLADVIPSNIDKKAVDGEKEVMLCNYIDVYKNDFITSAITFMEATASDAQIEKLTLRSGDVIATKDSEDPNDIAVPALVRNDFQKVVCGYHLTLIRTYKDALNGEYLFWLLSSKGYKQFFSTQAKGVTRYALGVSSFKNLPIPIPPSSEQTQIAKYLDHKTSQIDKLITDKEKTN